MRPIFQKVTKDEYRLPIEEADSIHELAEKIGVSVSAVSHAMHEIERGERKDSCYQITWIEEGDDLWKPIEGYKYPYRINEKGAVQRYCNPGWKNMSYIKHDHSFEVQLRGKDGRQVGASIGRLMANAFLGGISDDEIVLHKNGIKSDFRKENLIITKKKGEHHSCVKAHNRRAVQSIDMQGRVRNIYPSQKDAAEGEHLNVKTIRKSCDDKSGAFVVKTRRRYCYMDE